MGDAQVAGCSTAVGRRARSWPLPLRASIYALLPKLRKTAEFNLRLAFPEWDEAQRQADHSRHGPKPGMDGCRVRATAALHEREHRAGRDSRRSREFSGGPATRQRRFIFDRAYRRVGAIVRLPTRSTGFRCTIWRVRSTILEWTTWSIAIGVCQETGPIFKNESARALLKILRDAGTVGILADQNTMPEEGVFVDFFGTPACTTTGLARVALHTDAAVVPGYAFWDPQIAKYRLRFEPAVDLSRSGDTERDVLVNTQKFTKVIEEIIRKHPDQWVWVHARWKTRPKGEAPLYDFLS